MIASSFFLYFAVMVPHADATASASGDVRNVPPDRATLRAQVSGVPACSATFGKRTVPVKKPSPTDRSAAPQGTKDRADQILAAVQRNVSEFPQLQCGVD